MEEGKYRIVFSSVVVFGCFLGDKYVDYGDNLGLLSSNFPIVSWVRWLSH